VSECKEGEKRNEEKQPVPSCLMQKEALVALSVLDSIIRYTGVDGSVIKAIDTMGQFVSKT
jgi:hypothetical protein